VNPCLRPTEATDLQVCRTNSDDTTVPRPSPWHHSVPPTARRTAHPRRFDEQADKPVPQPRGPRCPPAGHSSEDPRTNGQRTNPDWSAPRSICVTDRPARINNVPPSHVLKGHSFIAQGSCAALPWVTGPPDRLSPERAGFTRAAELRYGRNSTHLTGVRRPIDEDRFPRFPRKRTPLGFRCVMDGPNPG